MPNGGQTGTQMVPAQILILTHIGSLSLFFYIPPFLTLLLLDVKVATIAGTPD